ncbi:MAG: hypothetical protein HY870_06480 [Chloroflexi bacterium]|nr:hypothetical protein [Chloroflexota bacterium]
MMLLGTLPQSLFQPLAAPGAPVYVRLLLDIYRQTQARPDPLSRDLILNLIYQQLAEPQALALTDDAQADEPTAPDQIDPLTARASAIVRYLDRCGWLKGETLSDFTVHYILPDYAFRLLRVLDEIAANEPPALAGLVFSTYALLQRILTEPDTAYVGIPQAHRQTQHLLNGLKELQQNIGLHINQILAQSQARDVLEQLFLRYREEIVDRAYHQLRTTDHISRFRPGVLSSVTQLAAPDILDPAAQRLRHMERGGAATIDQARQHLLTQLHEIRDQFEALDRLLESIDARHGQFVNAAVRQIELQLAAHATTSGQLNTIIETLLNTSPVDFEPTVDPLIHLHRLEWLDPESLAAPTRTATLFEAEAEVSSVISPEDLARALEDTERQLSRAISHKRIERYAREQLGDRAEMHATEIPLSDPEQLALLIYLRAYGDGTLGYRVEELSDGPLIEHDGFAFHDFIIKANTP